VRSTLQEVGDAFHAAGNRLLAGDPTACEAIVRKPTTAAMSTGAPPRLLV
jgi:hypothetical protein